MWPFDYFAKKRAKEREELKQALLNELESELSKKVADRIASGSQQLSAISEQAKSELARIRGDFLKSVRDEKSGLDRKVAGIENKVNDTLSEMETKAREQYNMTRDAAERAKKAEASVQESRKLVNDARQEVQKASGVFSQLEQARQELLALRNKAFLDVEARAKAAFTEQNKQYAQSVDVKLNDAVAKLSTAKNEYDALKNTYKSDLERLRSEHLRELQKLREQFTREKDELVQLFTTQGRNVSYCMNLTRDQRRILIELHARYNGEANAFKREREVMSKRVQNSKALDVIRENLILQEILDQQTRFGFDAKNILYKLDAQFRQDYDSALKKPA